MRAYTYYRAGVAVAKLRISASSVLFSGRDLKTMEFEPEQPFSWPMAPLDETLDKRFPDAVGLIQSGRIPSTYEPAGTLPGIEGSAAFWIQPLGSNPLDLLIAEDRIVACIDNERNYIGLLVEDGWEAITPQAAHNDPKLSRPEHGIEPMGTFMVEMRDGVHLATDVYLPTNRKPDQKFPTVLIRTCYNKLDTAQFFVFAHYGYAIVAQDTRGRELSEGVWQPIINECDDGDDTLNWIAAQEWSDGGVGMIGASYLAIVQWQAAASGNKHLKAIISMVTGGVPMFDFPHRSGVLSPGTIAWITSMRQRKFRPEDMERDDWEQILSTRPIRDIPAKGLGEEISFWNEWMEHPYYDGYWHKANWLSQQHKIDVPALYISGWYDDVGPGSMQAWDMNRRNGRANQKLVCGAWRHKMNVARDMHGCYYGPESVRTDMFVKYLRWYDHFLKGIDNGAENAPAAEYFTIGENRWHSSSAWPPAEAEDRDLFLTGGGNAQTSRGDGITSFSAPAAGEDHYAYDPRNPAPFLIDISENECLVPENYRDVELRQDVLVYTSEPLEADLTIAGEPRAVLYASSSARDTDWVVRLTDVDPEGNSIRLSDGILRARFRKSYAEPTLLIPGEVVRYDIPMTWISNCFQAGHRIRVEITSGADNSVFPNTNTGGPMYDDKEGEFVIADQTVYHGGQTPSRIILPVIE